MDKCIKSLWYNENSREKEKVICGKTMKYKQQWRTRKGEMERLLEGENKISFIFLFLKKQYRNIQKQVKQET